MSTPRIIRAAQTLLHRISRMAQAFTKGLINWLLRSLLVLGRQPRWSKAGFVLPTTILLLLVVTLTVGAIGFRTFTRTQQTIGERQQRVIYNAATPALDRAKAKLEFLFDLSRDPRGGVVPKEDNLLHMMLNDGGSGVSAHSSGIDPYTFTDSNAALDEKRIDIGGPNGAVKDNAWKYRADTNGDGTLDAWVAYSIIFQTPANKDELKDTRDTVGAANRAATLQIRNTPLSSATQISSCRPSAGGTGGVPQTNDEGWFKDPVNTTILRKNFQVDVYVLPDNPNGAIATIEFQQDRQASQGFKWAAWFRNDIEVFPGPEFNWNGAMHSEGSFFVSGPFKGYMISSIASCLYTQDASEITTSKSDGDVNLGIPAFQGQFLAGTVRDNSFGGSPSFDLWNGANVMPVRNSTMDSGKDSVTTTLKPADFALDPVKLHTDDISVSRNPSIADPSTQRDPGWKNRPLNQKKRMYNLAQDTPYVDDTFRADNRWGPKPRWGLSRKRIGPIGSPIIGNVALTGDDPAPGADSTNIGLDGYWERRARREGLRLIVGQRLELGDPAGWGGPGETPLNPTDVINPYPSDDASRISKEPLRPWAGCGSSNTPRCNEARQRKTLWDNLASVQATAVYHAFGDAGGNLDFPLACIATTVHPGTAGTLDKSGTFENLAYGLPNNTIAGYTNAAQPLIISDFFRGRGTNGWEYKVPSLTDFSTSTSPLRTALRNLAQFAGDPQGGTPSFQPPPDTALTPYPLMSMWGDFSMLRRVIDLMEGSGISYDALSPADKTTLHTAGCTLGMLAYNLDYLEKLPKARTLPTSLIGTAGLVLKPNSALPISPENVAASEGLRGYIRLIDAAVSNKNTASPQVTMPDGDRNFDNVPDAINKNTSTMPGNMDKMVWDSAASNNPETYVRLMERWRDRLSTTDPERDNLTKAIYIAQLLITREQVARDRTYGFIGTYGSVTGDFLSPAPLGECKDWEISKDELRRLCSSRPRYPILYSLFPARVTRGLPATANIQAWYSSANGFENHGDIKSERPAYQHLNVRDKIDSDDSYIRFTANASVEYKVVRPELVATLPRGAQGMGSSEAWKLPIVAAADGSTPNSNSQNLIKVCATALCSQPQSAAGRAPAMSSPRFRVPFKDAGLYNGRELMSVRTLDLDLDLMRTNATPAGDFWLPKSGIIYAFREDAVSEAHISRPKKGNWSTCASDAALQAGSLQSDDNCRMRTSDSYDSNFDPPLSPLGITPKPVDFFADPDRRPYGFRLRNGVTVRRTGDNGIGLSFITDNPAYVQGPFNLHQTFGATDTAGGAGLEEFITPSQKLLSDFSNFYTRDTPDITQFSIPTVDQWRPSEVLADAVTPLSVNFCDGSIEDSFMTAGNGSYVNVSQRYGCSNSGNETSYGNQPRLTGSVTAAQNNIKWMRSNVIDSLWPATVTGSDTPVEGESPIFIHPYGNPMTITPPGEYKGAYDTIDKGRKLIDGVDGTQMNMIMVSGIVPSRAGQAYGGLHNFPRFLENWSGKKLFLSGAFLQLNFSTYATAPFDQQNWQPGDADPTTGTGNDEWIRYYGAPNRVWGYDVGLQYAPAGPVARRFKVSLPTRSEFYSEPAATDPYIRNLCRSISTIPANCP